MFVDDEVTHHGRKRNELSVFRVLFFPNGAARLVSWLKPPQNPSMTGSIQIDRLDFMDGMGRTAKWKMYNSIGPYATHTHTPQANNCFVMIFWSIGNRMKNYDVDHSHLWWAYDHSGPSRLHSINSTHQPSK